ncbi:MAG: hypothetical protein M1820_004669 [Bogoriella megaspora]|nr:MAG: hypothetical protein M1820_004669 [Bogoriella megaspora]
MPGRQPTRDDFPTSVTLSITPPPSNYAPTNVLILLHGLGDTHASFETLGKQLALPETTCISIRAPKPLPFDLGGFHWGDDIMFDQASGEMEFDTGFKEASHVIAEEVIQKTLVEKCGYKLRDIVFFGFGQGGMAAFAAAADRQISTGTAPIDFGGLISIGGVMPDDGRLTPSQKNKTPVLICGGTAKSAVTASAVDKIKTSFEYVEVKKWKKAGDGMPANREEMLPIMQFFSRRLRSTRGIPAGSVEMT